MSACNSVISEILRASGESEIYQGGEAVRLLI